MRSILRELPPRTHAPGEFLSVIAYVPRMWHRDTFKFLSTQTGVKISKISSSNSRMNEQTQFSSTRERVHAVLIESRNSSNRFHSCFSETSCRDLEDFV